MLVWMRLILAALLMTVAFAQPLESLGAPQILELQGKLYHVQGVDLDDAHVWVTSVDTAEKKGYLHEFAWPSGELRRTVELQDGVRFHPGGISTDAEAIWIPVAEYRRSSSAVIQKRDKRTLELLAKFEVADHIGCLAANRDVLVGGNWDSRELYVWDHRGKLLRKIPNETGNGFQDLKFVGDVLVGGGLLPGHAGAVDWMEFPSLRLQRRITVGKTDRGKPYTQEGMAIRNGRLYLLPEDGPSRLFSFRLPG